MKEKSFNYPMFIHAKDISIRVVNEFDSTDEESYDPKSFIPGKGYLDLSDNYVWIFSVGKPININRYPYFWFNENGKLEKHKPEPDIIREFSYKCLVDLSTDKIIEEAKNDIDDTPLISDDLLNNINTSVEVFHPIIYAQDDLLKKCIKSVFNEIDVSLNKFKSKVKEKYVLTNLRSALTLPTKMSTKYFNIWAEILGLKITIIIESNEDAEDKLSEPLVYVSERDTVYRISDLDDEIKGFTFPEIPRSNSED